MRIKIRNAFLFKFLEFPNSPPFLFGFGEGSQITCSKYEAGRKFPAEPYSLAAIVHRLCNFLHPGTKGICIELAKSSKPEALSASHRQEKPYPNAADNAAHPYSMCIIGPVVCQVLYIYYLTLVAIIL